MNQEDIVFDYMKKNNGITSMEAYEIGVTRLSAIIFNLRAKHDIKDTWETTINRYGVQVRYKRYFVAKEHQPFWKKLLKK